MASTSIVLITVFVLSVFTLSSGVHAQKQQPRPQIARIIVSEGNGVTSYGSGTLIDVRGKFGLVVTNWHVVRDAKGKVEVVFPDGFRSHAKPLKVDADWDLAALVIWRPKLKPVKLATKAPKPGDVLTICGYGKGNYREATGRCTQYLAPRVDFPREMVELSVEARQGDSGGPIFNAQGEMAGVLFGASEGTTLGSFGGRVGDFLTSLVPDIQRSQSEMLAAAKTSQGIEGVAMVPVDNQTKKQQQNSLPEPEMLPGSEQLLTRGLESQEGTNDYSAWPNSERAFMAAEENRNRGDNEANRAYSNTPVFSSKAKTDRTAFQAAKPPQSPTVSLPTGTPSTEFVSWEDVAGKSWFQQGKTVLALFGLVFVLLQAVRFAA